jgi:hypothetical protein
MHIPTNSFFHVLSHRRRPGWLQREWPGRKRGTSEWENSNGNRKRCTLCHTHTYTHLVIQVQSMIQHWLIQERDPAISLVEPEDVGVYECCMFTDQIQISVHKPSFTCTFLFPLYVSDEPCVTESKSYNKVVVCSTPWHSLPPPVLSSSPLATPHPAAGKAGARSTNGW